MKRSEMIQKIQAMVQAEMSEQKKCLRGNIDAPEFITMVLDAAEHLGMLPPPKYSDVSTTVRNEWELEDEEKENE